MPGGNQVFCLMRLKSLRDRRGPGPLQSGKVWEDKGENLISPRRFTQRDEGLSAIGSFFTGKSELSSNFNCCENMHMHAYINMHAAYNDLALKIRMHIRTFIHFTGRYVTLF